MHAQMPTYKKKEKRKRKKLNNFTSIAKTQKQGWGSVKYLSVERGSTGKRV
jgi:hypothetical protein